jgi:hypothetical protein
MYSFRTYSEVEVARVIVLINDPHFITLDHHHHISVMELGHLLTRFGLVHPEDS